MRFVWLSSFSMANAFLDFRFELLGTRLPARVYGGRGTVALV
jgi:hypothetical protein